MQEVVCVILQYQQEVTYARNSKYIRLLSVNDRTVSKYLKMRRPTQRGKLVWRAVGSVTSSPPSSLSLSALLIGCKQPTGDTRQDAIYEAGGGVPADRQRQGLRSDGAIIPLGLHDGRGPLGGLPADHRTI